MRLFLFVFVSVMFLIKKQGDHRIALLNIQ